MYVMYVSIYIYIYMGYIDPINNIMCMCRAA